MSKTAAAKASTAAPEVAPPHYRVFHVFPKKTAIWSAGERLVACEAQIFWISPTGRVVRLDLQLSATEPPPGTIRFQAPIEWNREVWLMAEAEVGTALLRPETPSEVTRPLPL